MCGNNGSNHESFLAKLYTDLHSRFSQRRFAKKLGKKEEDFAAGRTTVEPEPHQHSRRIEGLVMCRSSEGRCPLYGGRKLDRDGNAARSIGDAFFAWLSCLPPPSFMEKVRHPEDTKPENINLTRGSSSLLRFLKERYPRPILDRTINRLLVSLEMIPLHTAAISALLSGQNVPREVFMALLRHFGPMLMQHLSQEGDEEEEEEVPQEADYDAAEEEQGKEAEAEPPSTDDDSDDDDDAPSAGDLIRVAAREAKQERKLIRKIKADGLRQQAQDLFQQAQADCATNAALLSSSVALAESAARSAEAEKSATIAEAEFRKDEEQFTQLATASKKAADKLKEAAEALKTSHASSKSGADAARNAYTAADKGLSAKADAANAFLDQARQYDMSTDEEGSQPQPPSPRLYDMSTDEEGSQPQPPSPLVSVAQQLGDSQGTQGGTDSESDDLFFWEKKTQQSSLLKTSQGHGKAMDPEATSPTLSSKQFGSVDSSIATALPRSVSTDSAGSNQVHLQGAPVEDTSSADVNSGVSSSQGNGDGKEGEKTGNVEEKSDDTTMSTILKGNNQPPPPPPPPPLTLPPTK